MLHFCLSIVLSFSILIFSGCKEHKDNKVTIDFSQKDITNYRINQDSANTFKVAISAMISPKRTFVYYQELLEYLSKKNNCKIFLEQRKTYQEVNALIESGEIDFAFICSGAYVELSSKCKIDIIAVPVINCSSTYQAYIIANKKSKINCFEDFKGKSFAYTDLLSNSGRLYSQKRLMEIGYIDKHFFSSIVYSNAHDNSIRLVNNGIVDGATVDGLIYNYIQSHNPEEISNIKIIEKSEKYAIPPIVSRTDKKKKLEKIRNSILQMADDKEGAAILSKLMIDRFVVGYDSSYKTIRNIRNIVNK
jgi:phosphonate transport system substrate-binding protein